MKKLMIVTACLTCLSATAFAGKGGYGELSEEERAGDPVALLSAHPTLMKRPVIEDGDGLTLGWDAEAQARWL